MAQSYKLAIILTAIDKASKELKTTTSSSDKLTKSWNKLKIAGGLVAAASAAVALKLVNMASDAEETSSKFNTVFGSIATEANVMADSLAKDFGLSSMASKKLLGDTGDLLTGFGFTQESALDLSTEVNKLAVDLASFTNFSGGAEGASAALTKALLGERESVKSLGISILEEDVKKKVAINTAKGLTFETERQAKAYATLQIAQEQSKNAIGDFARTSDGYANQVRILKGRITDLSVELGQELLPVAKDVVGIMVKAADKTIGLVRAIKQLQEATNAFQTIQKPTNDIVQKFVAVLKLVQRPLIAGTAAMIGQGKEARRLFKEMVDLTNELTNVVVETEDIKQEKKQETIDKEKAAAEEKIAREADEAAKKLEIETKAAAEKKKRDEQAAKDEAAIIKTRNDRYINLANTLAGSWSGSLVNMMKGTVKFSRGIKDIFTDVGHSVIRMIGQMIAKWLTFVAMKGVLNLFSGGTLGTAVFGAGSLLKSAIGFAGGGILNEPVIGQGLRSGRSYSFAERGPEAILNASQMSQMSGMGGGVTIKNYFSGNQVMGDSAMEEFATKISEKQMDMIRLERNV